VEPENRLVADTLEAEWNEKLRGLNQAQEHYETQCQAQERSLEPQQKAAVLALAEDFPRLWRSPETPHRERKRMLRLLVEDVTLLGGPHIDIHVRFKGGTTTSLHLPPAPTSRRYPATARELVTRIDQLLDDLSDAAVAASLTEEGFTAPESKPLDTAEVQRLRRAHHLPSRYQRLRRKGLLTGPEMARLLGVSPPTVDSWREHGLLLGHPCDARNKYLYDPPGENVPVPSRGRKLSERLKQPTSLPSTDGGAV
jgi:DNA-binding transcriptional regulator YiaG